MHTGFNNKNILKIFCSACMNKIYCIDVCINVKMKVLNDDKLFQEMFIFMT